MPRSIPRWLIVLIGLVIIVVVGSAVRFSARVTDQTERSPTNVAAHSTAPVLTSGKGTKTVFLIVMENHNWSDIKNNPSAPYINQTLLPMASYSRAVLQPAREPPKRTELSCGWRQGPISASLMMRHPGLNHQQTTQHLVTLLNNAHISWKSYQEGISGTVCPLTGSGLYAPKHNPMVYFDDVTNTMIRIRPTALRMSGPIASWPQTYSTIPRHATTFITPNLCNDMHDACAPLNDPVKQGDTWLAQNLPAILNSQAYRNGGVVFITWDEGEGGGDGPIGMIVLSHDGKGGGYSNTIHYTHSSTLRTLQEIFGVGPFLGDAAHATDLRDLFKTFP